MKKSIKGDYKNNPEYVVRFWTNPSKDSEFKHVHEAIAYHNGKEIGSVTGWHDHKGEIHIGHAELYNDHQGKGLGQAMYEHVYKEAAKHGGHTIVSTTPSEDAFRVHEKLAAKHGLKMQTNSTQSTFKYKNPFSKSMTDLLTQGKARALAKAPVRGPSKHIPLERLKQIQRDHGLSHGGKEYSSEELAVAVNERAQTQAEKLVTIAKQKQKLAAQNAGGQAPFSPPKFPKRLAGSELAKEAAKKDTSLVHYSKTPGLKQLDPNKMGSSGVGGAQYKRGVPENKSTFYYTADSQPEALVTQNAQSKYLVQPNPEHKVYDLGLDPEHLVREARARNQGAWNEDVLHGLIKEKGYHGVKWKMHDTTHVVQMYQPMDVHSEEDLTQPKKLAATEKPEYNEAMGELLTKGFIRNAAMAGVLALAPGQIQTQAPPKQPAQIQQTSTAQAKPQKPVDSFKHKMLRTIAQVESSGGKNTNHEQITGGMHDQQRAYGSYGLMPITIKETVARDPALKEHRSLVQMDHKQLHEYMAKNPTLEHAVAKSHLQRLRGHFGDDPVSLSFAWLNGITGTKRALKAGKDLSQNWHVQKIKTVFDQKAPKAPVRQSLTQKPE